MPRPQHAPEESILPEVPRPPRPRIVILRVAAMDPAQEQAERRFPLRNRNQMNVIRHQTPSENGRLGLGHVFQHQPQVGATILIGGKGLAPIHAALSDVVRYARRHASIPSGHESKESAATAAEFSKKSTQIRLSPLKISP